MKLVELIQRHKQALLERYIDALYAAGASKALSRDDVRDNCDKFVGELIWAIEHESTTDWVKADAEAEHPSAIHGRQRHALGYDLGTVIREYGILGDLIRALIEEHGEAISSRELHALWRHLMAGVVASATTYGREKEDALQKTAEKHLAFLAHELRNPIGALRMSLELASRKEESVRNRALGHALRSTRQLSELVDGALIELRLRNQGTADRIPLDLAELLRELAADWTHEVEARGLRLQLEAPGTLEVEADRRLMRSVLANLVHNAVKFSKSGGNVVVRARAAEGRAFVEVEDSCGGLPKEEQAKLFDPFVQVGADRSGFGLGLAIAKQAATAHEGELRVHSLDGKGCVFVLDFPVKRSS